MIAFVGRLLAPVSRPLRATLVGYFCGCCFRFCACGGVYRCVCFSVVFCCVAVFVALITCKVRLFCPFGFIVSGFVTVVVH